MRATVRKVGVSAVAVVVVREDVKLSLRRKGFPGHPEAQARDLSEVAPREAVQGSPWTVSLGGESR